VSGKTVPAHYGPRRAGDPPELVADSAKARRLLGWQPRYDDITALVSTAWDWYNGGLRRVSASEERQPA
jgi:UDP-glucose 4-epimerase